MLNTTKFFAFALLSFAFHISNAQDSLVIVKSGHIPKSEIFKLIYVPVEVPKGSNSILVEEFYNTGEGDQKNVLNMGIYDPRGSEIGNPKGFRGWSGGAKTSFFINNSTASTGYIPGQIYSGSWKILIYPSDVSDSGIDWTLKIKAVKGRGGSLFKPNFANSSINKIPGWYYGDLHMHTLHSDGKRTAQELIEEAHFKKLDFIISTEHNTNSANLEWGKYDSQDLLIINGEEVTSTQFGHWNAIGLIADNYIDWRYPPEEQWINKMVDKVHQDNGLAIINHPYYNIQLKNNFKYDSGLFDGVEVWNGSWNLLDNLAVNWWNDQLIAGHKLIAIGASDTHVSEGSSNNLGAPQTVVYAESLSKNGIINGMKNGKVYIRANGSIKVIFEAIAGNKKAMLGEILVVPKNQDSFSIHLQIENCKKQNVKIFSNLGLFKEAFLNSDDEHLSFHVNDPNIKFLRMEIRDGANNMLALTNPIFISY